MPNPLAAHPPWRQILVVSVFLPIVAVAAILAFAYPSARLAPRDVPVGVVGSGAGATQLSHALQHEHPGAFDLRLYSDTADARRAIEHRDVYGAFVVGGAGTTVLTASAASPTVATLLETTAHAADPHARAVDVLPTASGDPRGAVLSSAVLPLTMCAVLIAAVVALMLRFRPAWRQIVAVTIVCATAALGAYLIVQGYLGALPGDPLATWAALGLYLLAVAAAIVGLVSLAGAAGLGLGAATMIFLGNAFSGATSAPEMLPIGAGRLGQWLPTGAGVNLLRSTAYFHGHGAGTHVAVLTAWAVLGLGAVVIGHRPALRFAASPQRAQAPAEDVETVDHDEPLPEPVIRPALVVSAAGRHEQHA